MGYLGEARRGIWDRVQAWLYAERNFHLETDGARAALCLGYANRCQIFQTGRIEDLPLCDQPVIPETAS